MSLQRMALDTHPQPLKVDYAENVGKVRFTSADVVQHTIIPSDIVSIPKIIGWSGPARVGTTALLFVLANHPDVSRIYFQPQKTLLREGGPDFVLHAGDNTICMKEVFGQMYREELYDPVDMLLKAGVPSSKINWIVMLRDPAQVFASWYTHFAESNPAVFIKAQHHSVKQYYHYKSVGINVVPLAYELLGGQEELIIDKLSQRLGLSREKPLDLRFASEAIEKKLVPGQAADEEYYNLNLKPTRDRERFIFSSNNYPIPMPLIKIVRQHCRKEYQDFLELSQRELGVRLEQSS
jgi:hypothetical protein